MGTDKGKRGSLSALPSNRTKFGGDKVFEQLKQKKESPVGSDHISCKFELGFARNASKKVLPAPGALFSHQNGDENSWIIKNFKKHKNFKHQFPVATGLTKIGLLQREKTQFEFSEIFEISHRFWSFSF